MGAAEIHARAMERGAAPTGSRDRARDAEARSSRDVENNRGRLRDRL
jgi:hypothetical protein